MMSFITAKKVFFIETFYCSRGFCGEAISSRVFSSCSTVRSHHLSQYAERSHCDYPDGICRSSKSSMVSRRRYQTHIRSFILSFLHDSFEVKFCLTAGTNALFLIFVIVAVIVSFNVLLITVHELVT
jgi:hypothetical protein